MKLNQVIALVTGKKAKATQILTTVHRGWQPDRLMGIEKTYQPIHEDGTQLPPESKKVQLRVKDQLASVRRSMTDFYGLVATQEIANCEAKADVNVGGTKILKDVPVGALLFIEKQLVNLFALANQIPVLDVDKTWGYDANAGLYSTPPVETLRTQKIEEPLVLYPATPEHPAQCKMVSKDVPAGKWTTTHLSGCMAADEKERMLDRIEALQEGVKKARILANTRDVQQTEGKNIAKTVLDFVFTK